LELQETPVQRLGAIEQGMEAAPDVEVTVGEVYPFTQVHLYPVDAVESAVQYPFRPPQYTSLHGFFTTGAMSQKEPV
jgi:hypothetical protein